MVSISRRMYVGITILDRTRVQACSCTGIIERVEIPFPSNKIIYLVSPREKPIKITILYRKKIDECAIWSCYRSQRNVLPAGVYEKRVKNSFLISTALQ